MDTEPNRPKDSETSPGQPELSPAERQRVFRAAARRVAATVLGTQPESIERVLADVAGRPLLGAFVSLKRGGRLRSCCGHMGDRVPLAEAVGQAAVRAAKDDPRFPPIAADELDQLDAEVWILWNLEAVPGHGAARAAGFEIGKHGLQVSSGKRAGIVAAVRGRRAQAGRGRFPTTGLSQGPAQCRCLARRLGPAHAI